MKPDELEKIIEKRINERQMEIWNLPWWKQIIGIIKHALVPWD